MFLVSLPILQIFGNARLISSASFLALLYRPLQKIEQTLPQLRSKATSESTFKKSNNCGVSNTRLYFLLYVYDDCNRLILPPRLFRHLISFVTPITLTAVFNLASLEILPHTFDINRLLQHQCNSDLHYSSEKISIYILFQIQNLASFHKLFLVTKHKHYL